MGFFKKLFHIGGKKNKMNKQEEFTTMSHLKASTLPLLPSKRDSEAAVSRLLRSSSAHFNVVSEVDYSTLPPIPHPINTLSASSIGSPSRSPSVRTKSTYTVTVHERVKHSQTEFPNAYPPLDKANSSLESYERGLFSDYHKSTPNLHDIKKLHRTPSRKRQYSDPRKVPFTPRDTNRLNNLRQDPSVVSLLNMYDDKGRLDERAFSNTPRANKLRRESTFKELLALDDLPENDSKDTSMEENEGDFSWAERFIAESNQSCSSLSTVSSPPVHTPTFPESISGNGIRDADTTLSTTESAGLPAISSLEVELSLVEDDNIDVDIRTICETPEKKGALLTTPSVTDISSQRVMRTPSKRASQVFNFLSEKRERRKSQSARDVLTNTEQTPPLNPVKGQAVNQIGQMIIPTIFVDEYKSRPIIDPDVTDSDDYLRANPLPSSKLKALQLPMPPPVSPFVIHGLPAAPRSKSRSTGAADSLKLQQRLDERERENRLSNVPKFSSNTQSSRERPSRATRGSTGAAVMLGGEEERLREHENQRANDKERLGLIRGPRPLPGAPTSASNLLRQGSYIPVRKDSERRVAFGELTNGLVETRATTRPLSKDGRVVRSKVYKEPRSSEEDEGMNHISRPKRLGSISRASESSESLAFAGSIGKASIGRASNRTSSSLTAVFELSRSSTTSKIETSNRPVSALVQNPGTPVRSHSFAEVPSPASSSELSPEARQMMTDLRAKRMRARYANAQRDAEIQARNKDIRNGYGRPSTRRQ